MNLAAAITVSAGGPGSGCRGPNCGRPSEGGIQYPNKPQTGVPYSLDVYHSSNDGKASLQSTGIFFHTEKEQSRIFGDQTSRYHVELRHPKVYEDEEDMLWDLDHGEGEFGYEGKQLYRALELAYEKIGYDPDPVAMRQNEGVRTAFRNLDTYIRQTLEKKGYDGVLLSANWMGHGEHGLEPMVEARKFNLDGIRRIGAAE